MEDFNTSFQVMHQRLLSHLKEQDKVVEFSSNFGPNKVTSDMFAYLWKSNEIHDIIKIHIIHAGKDIKNAEYFRNEGNKFYKNKDLKNALDYYNKSIIYSSHPNNLCINFSKQAVDSSISRNLAVSYANRSAVLYELENFDDCLKDITRALNYEYPTLLRPKLIERQAKCYIALNRVDSAKELLNKYIAEVKTMGNNEIDALEKSMEKLNLVLSSCDSLRESLVLNESSSFLLQKKLCNLDLLDIPQLNEVNSTIPSLSSSVKLIHSSEKGRYLIANKDILPGELLVKEKSFSAAVLPSALLTHCSFCLKRTFIPLPCPNCSNVVFCSDYCAVNGKLQFHEIECTILPTLMALDVGRNSNLALRLVIQMTLDGLRNKVPFYDQEKVEKSNLEVAYNCSNIYDSSDFRTIYNLVTNLENRSVSDLFKRGVITVCLVKLLLKSSYFGHSISDCMAESIYEDISLVGKTLFTLLMSLPCNAHSITEMSINSKNYQESHMEEIGAGAFGVLSLTNHSCNPSIARTSYGSTIVARAINFIPKGAEITDSYGYHYAIHNIEERQKELQKQYYFSCSCEACIGMWIQYPSFCDEIFLKCPQCFSKLEIPIDDCFICKTNICSFFNGKSSTQIYKDVKNAITSTEMVIKKISGGQLNKKHQKDFTETIYLLCLYTYLPNKLLFEAQEMFKFYFDVEGSHYYI